MYSVYRVLKVYCVLKVEGGCEGYWDGMGVIRDMYMGIRQDVNSMTMMYAQSNHKLHSIICHLAWVGFANYCVGDRCK